MAPQLIALYEDYSPMGFHVIGVSIDTKRESWIRAIADDRLPWEHVSDLKPESVSDNTVRYNITAIPANYLINQKGEIVAIDIPLHTLDNMLKKELFNTKKLSSHE